MAALHSALKALGPVDFSDVPTDMAKLETYLGDLFTQAECVLESIPILEPSSKDADEQIVTAASSAAEIQASSARSAAPADEAAALQKEWGKAVKLGAKENAMGLSVHKLSAKDGRGAWFARRSVHAGLGFSKFKKGLQQEFEQSLAVHGAPGEGNVRGIGGEERVEQIEVPGKGMVEVYRLSAQFPGPTTPRDFVTLLVTSDTAMDGTDSHATEATQKQRPRHYMIISKPCNHPETQPRDGFIRGSYESVEFIREVPRVTKVMRSATDLAANEQQTTDSISNSASNSRNRSATVPSGSNRNPGGDGTDDELNPVEWIMVTRSDPGGSVPRFMVERGTPSSICADAVKFLDWACTQDFDKDAVIEDKDQTDDALNVPPQSIDRRGSFQSFRSSRLAGVTGDIPSADKPAQPVARERTREVEVAAQEEGSHSGILGAVYGAASSIGAYTPQVVLDHLPGGAAASTEPVQSSSALTTKGVNGGDDDDSDSILSATSFASAEDYFSSSNDDDNDNDAALKTQSDQQATRENKEKEKKRKKTQHEKDLQKLEDRRVALDTKYQQTKTKLEQEADTLDNNAPTSSNQDASSNKESETHTKAREKNAKELRKHQEKYDKQLEKIERAQAKQRNKIETKKRKDLEKDERVKLTRERDEARTQLEQLRKDNEILTKSVEELQRSNTELVARLGRIEAAVSGSVPSSVSVGVSDEKGSRNRSRSSASKTSSLRRLTIGSSSSLKDKDKNISGSTSNLRHSQEL